MPRILIFHITHANNLASVLQRSGLYSNNHTPPSTSIQRSAHPSIQAKRASFTVPVGPGGALHDYVPFYFGARSPMLYAIHHGYVPSVHHAQGEMSYLVGEFSRLQRSGRPWVFTDGHAIHKVTRFFDDPADLCCLDWETIHADQWSSTPDDPDRKRRKQAECLVYEHLPLSALAGVAVMDPATAARVQALLTAASGPLPVKPRPDWYF